MPSFRIITISRVYMVYKYPGLFVYSYAVCTTALARGQGVLQCIYYPLVRCLVPHTTHCIIYYPRVLVYHTALTRGQSVLIREEMSHIPHHTDQGARCIAYRTTHCIIYYPLVRICLIYHTALTGGQSVLIRDEMSHIPHHTLYYLFIHELIYRTTPTRG